MNESVVDVLIWCLIIIFNLLCMTSMFGKAQKLYDVEFLLKYYHYKSIYG